MNLILSFKERLGNAFWAILFGTGTFLCGAVMVFLISPQQGIEWRRINSLPELTPETLAAVGMGEPVVITGSLSDNVLFDHELVAYRLDRWEVVESEDINDPPVGSWVNYRNAFPDLTLLLGGTPVQILAYDNVTISGALHESITQGPVSPLGDDYEGEFLYDGASRYQGFTNGDRVSVYGEKSSTGGIVPKRLYGGDRVQLVGEIRSSARGALFIGIGMMAFAPILIVGGFARSLFGRDRKRKNQMRIRS